MHISKLKSARHPVLPLQNAHRQTDGFFVSSVICRRRAFYLYRMHILFWCFFLKFVGLKTPRGSGRRLICCGPKSVDPRRCWLFLFVSQNHAFWKPSFWLVVLGPPGPSWALLVALPRRARGAGRGARGAGRQSCFRILVSPYLHISAGVVSVGCPAPPLNTSLYLKISVSLYLCISIPPLAL